MCCGYVLPRCAAAGTVLPRCAAAGTVLPRCAAGALILVEDCLVERFPRCAADTPTSYRRLHRSRHILQHTVLLIGSCTYILLLLILSPRHIRRHQRPAGWAHTLPKSQKRHLREPDSHLVIPGVSTHTPKSAFTSSRRRKSYASREGHDFLASFDP